MTAAPASLPFRSTWRSQSRAATLTSTCTRPNKRRVESLACACYGAGCEICHLVQVQFLHQEALLEALGDATARAVRNATNARTFSCNALELAGTDDLAAEPSAARTADAVPEAASSAEAADDAPRPAKVAKTSASVGQANAPTAAPRNDAKLARGVDSSVQRIDDFLVRFSTAPSTSNGDSSAVRDHTKALDLSVPGMFCRMACTCCPRPVDDGTIKPADGVTVADSERPESGAAVTDSGVSSQPRSGSAPAGAVATRKRPALSFEETRSSYLSVRNLVRDIKEREHRALSQLLREHQLVGGIDDKFSLIQARQHRCSAQPLGLKQPSRAA